MRSAILLVASCTLFAQSPKYGVGRAPTPDELRQWEVSVSPDGKGLPEGSGTVAAGKEIYANRCSRCHGANGEGRDSVPLAGGQGTLKNPKPLRTVGSYWPQATTLWDYVNRAMPFDRPGTLTKEQVYSVSAYVLFLNGLLPADGSLDAKSLPKIRMPNRDGFVPDPRPDTRAKVK
jgi:cytochrome c